MLTNRTAQCHNCSSIEMGSIAGFAQKAVVDVALKDRVTDVLAYVASILGLDELEGGLQAEHFLRLIRDRRH